jgi:hypothetical protein
LSAACEEERKQKVQAALRSHEGRLRELKSDRIVTLEDFGRR